MSIAGGRKAARDAFEARQVALPLVLRSRASGVSKDEADIRASWFETRQEALLTMRGFD
jgi:hypothetical protein